LIPASNGNSFAIADQWNSENHEHSNENQRYYQASERWREISKIQSAAGTQKYNNNSTYFESAANATMNFPILKHLPEQPQAGKATVQTGGAAAKEKAGQQGEWRRRKQWQKNAQHRQHDAQSSSHQSKGFPKASPCRGVRRM
jgi:hypothetical protein